MAFLTQVTIGLLQNATALMLLASALITGIMVPAAAPKVIKIISGLLGFFKLRLTYNKKLLQNEAAFLLLIEVIKFLCNVYRKIFIAHFVGSAFVGNSIFELGRICHVVHQLLLAGAGAC